MWKHPYIVNVPNLKTLIGTCQCLVAGEDSLTSLTDHHGPTSRPGKPDLPPETFCTTVYQLMALQVNKQSKIQNYSEISILPKVILPISILH